MTAGVTLVLIMAAIASRELAAQVLTTEAIAAKAVPATVTIVIFGPDNDTLGFGSGFLVRSNGVIVTNHHVMVGASRAAIFLASGERYDRVEALDSDPSADLAILKIPGYGLPVLRTTSELPPVGAKLVAVGNPLGLSHTVTEGIVSGVRLIDGRQLLQMSVPISPGSSGGPVLNGRGNVVAVTSRYLKDGQNLNFAVPIRYAMGLVEGGGRTVPLAQRFRGATVEATARATGSPAKEGGGDVPALTRTPRASIAGTYLVYEQGFVYDLGKAEGEPLEKIGLLMLSRHDIGYYVNKRPETDTALAKVWNVMGTNSTPDGRVSVELGGTVFSGYQTEKGLYLQASRVATQSQSGVRSRLDAEWHASDLSLRDGLYRLSTRTQFKSNQYGQVGDYFDWSGEAAIVVANDSVYIDMYLENSKGGGALGTFSGALDHQGGFDLRNGGRSLKGILASGRLSAYWIDSRDTGQFEGVLDGRRQ